MNLNNENPEALFNEIHKLIVHLRREEDIDINWPKFHTLIENNLNEVCKSLNTRWLVSIADTYADYGNEIEKRNALYISIFVNMEKLFATRLLMYDLILNPNKLKKLKSSSVFPLWDGMTSFNILNGNMTNNLFGRIRFMIKETPTLQIIFETVINKISHNDSWLSDLNLYHQRLFESPPKKYPDFTLKNKLKKVLKKLF